MLGKYTPKLNLQSDIMGTKLYNYSEPTRLDGVVQKNNGSSFSEVLGNMAGDLNQTMKAPDQILETAMLGKGADIHDVIVAMSKAEVGINIATQVTTKVVQAYEKVMSIQV